jgi:GTPase SAR1 family protein
MPIEHAGWVIPAVKEAYKHHEEFATAWEKIISFFKGKKSRIAITGMPGVGKSVLLEHLTGSAYRRNYEKPEQPSVHKETGNISARKKRLVLTTVPGQESGARYVALSELFESKKPVLGVVHVVANGFASIRLKSAQEHLVAAGMKTINDYRQHQLEAEIEDLRATASWIVGSVRKHHEMLWMLVVASKCDLYADNLDATEKYYSPYGHNGFVQQLELLKEKLGTLSFSWASLPVCATLEDFTWNGQTVKSQLQQQQRDQLITNLLRRIESACTI